jgi:hypothetical protein
VTLARTRRVPAPRQCVVADCEFRGSEVSSIRLQPITLKSDEAATDPERLHGDPRFVAGPEAAMILDRLRVLSQPLRTDIVVTGNSASVRLR